MTSASHNNMGGDSTLLELRADRAMVGLDDAQSSQWLTLLGDDADDRFDDDLELDAALLSRALLAAEGRLEQPPASMQQMLREAAGQWLRNQPKPFARPARARSEPALQQPSTAMTGSTDHSAARQSTHRPVIGTIGWAGWLAAAACLMLAAIAWWPQAQPSSAELRQQLLADASDLIEVPLINPFDDPAAAGAVGDIIWSDDRQEGYIRLRGVQPNDPRQQQYQLWIFRAGSLGDLATLEPHPVDGGVFDVSAAGEVVIPITAKLRVDQPTVFAITVEPPGGVVVSNRERIPLVGDALSARAG